MQPAENVFPGEFRHPGMGTDVVLDARDEFVFVVTVDGDIAASAVHGEVHRVSSRFGLRVAHHSRRGEQILVRSRWCASVHEVGEHVADFGAVEGTVEATDDAACGVE